MTVNSTSTRELDINRLVMLAIQKAGLLPAGAPRTGIQWDNLSAQARDFLELEVDYLQAQGALSRAVELYDIQLVAGTASYALPATTFSVGGDAMYAAPGEATQTVVGQIDRARYQLISDKTSQGAPTMYYAEAHATITLFLWTVPDAAGTLTVQRHRLLGDNNDGSKTLDLERHWAKYIVNAVAHEMAQAAGADNAKLGYLRSERSMALETSKVAGGQNTGDQIFVDHRTGWTR